MGTTRIRHAADASAIVSIVLSLLAASIITVTLGVAHIVLNEFFLIALVLGCFFLTIGRICQLCDEMHGDVETGGSEAPLQKTGRQAESSIDATSACERPYVTFDTVDITARMREDCALWLHDDRTRRLARCAEADPRRGLDDEFGDKCLELTRSEVQAYH